MFDTREWCKRGILNSIGKQPSYKIIEMTMKWVDKGVLELEDMAKIKNALDEYERTNGMS